jgi:hydrogenase maturation protease
MGRVRIVGLGSPHGDDQAAWLLVERLRRRPDLGAETAVVADAMGLLDCLSGCDKLILVDASQSGQAPGTVTRLTWPDASLQRWHEMSSHGFSVSSALALAEALGRLPATVVLLGIEIVACLAGGDPGPEVVRALSEVEVLVWEEVRKPDRRRPGA